MKNLFLTALVAASFTGSLLAVSYTEEKDWVRLAEVNARPMNQHGDIAVASNGEIYVSTMDPAAGIQVFSPEGKLLRNVPNAPNDFHGFVIRKDDTGEFIYGPRLSGETIVKLTLDGKLVLEIPASAIPDQFKNKVQPNTKKGPDGNIAKNPVEGNSFLRMTGIDVAPNGDIYVTDGYASDYVHRFDRTGKYLASFGGKKEPYSFKTLHKIAIDTRFTPARIIGLDRANLRVVHMSLDGEFLGVVATDLLLPSAVSIQGDYAVIGELKGRVTILDKEGKVVAHLGANDKTDEIGTNRTDAAKWRHGILNAAHGVTFDAKGNVYASEWTTTGRVHKFVKQ
jgi:hypothetical protein